MKRLALAILLLALTFNGVSAQTPVPTVAGPSSSVQAFFVACQDAAILNFTGTMLAGFDIYYQVFSGAAGSGTALTNLRQVAVAGDFAVSDRAVYNTGLTLAIAGTASAHVFVARETNSSRIDFDFVVTDVQDGCNNPTNPLVTAADLGATSDTSSTTTQGVAGVSTNILAPNGGVLNPNLSQEPAVVIGARLSDRFRSETPGLIFAECDAYPLAEPGIIYDNDEITIYWSWFTKTQAEMDDHIANALYTVQLNTAQLPMTTRSEPVKRNGNFWVFYTASVGDLFPGHYEVGYLVTWANPVNDGYNDYGPGTANTRQSGICNFDVLTNPDNESVSHNGMYFPTLYPVHDLATPEP